MKQLLERALLDETEFLGLRHSLALGYHRDHPYVTHCGDSQLVVDYEPGDSTSDTFGGNSNCAGRR